MSEGSDQQRTRFGIGELADLAKVQPSALRFYERHGLLTPAGRVGGRRVFDQDGLRQLATIDIWQEAGFAIEEIAVVVDSSAESVGETKRIAGARVEELNELIEQATRAKAFLTHVLKCEHPSLIECPHYLEYLQKRIEEIASGTYERGFHARLQLLRRQAAGDSSRRPTRSRSK